ncbi:hypothetical protein D9V86_01415 [Bacteroidetes/Chlorobi group bacterium ChocPot_Mid]|nr:MAG: hypothetical protein D9V86_01415 [Bacteroidetes/Chlorobi group bacterium ChocPot_Mid]
MNIKNLLPDSSRVTIDKATEFILKNNEQLTDIINITINENSKYALRASRVLHFCSKKKPDLIHPYLSVFIKELKENQNESIKGNLLSIFYEINLPDDEELLSELTLICFDFLNGKSKLESLAVNSIDILYKICNFYPELKNELIENLNSLMPSKKVAFQSRAKKYLNLLNNKKYS